MFSSLYILANLLFVLVSPSVPANNTVNLYEVKAKSGDGVFSLLRRYKLADYPCNITQFYKVNNLSSASYLKEGVSYKIPVYIYNYNGISIRSTIGIDNWEKAIRIKEYNENLHSEKLRQTNFLDSKLLWVPHHELHCADEASASPKTPAESSTSKSKSKSTAKEETKEKVAFKKSSKSVDLFGDSYKEVKVVDESLKDQVFYLVSGHGGPDPGTSYQGYSSRICEDEYAYDVVLRVARNLMQHGAQVEIIVQDKNDGIRDDRILICDYDEKYQGNKKISRIQLTRLADRTKIINDLYYAYKKKGFKNQKAIMIHVDSQSKSKRQDVYFYHYKNSKSSASLAKKLQATFKAKYDKYQKNRGYKGFVKDRGLYMLRNTLPSAVYIELANIKNKDDHQRLLRQENRQALANWIFEGVIEK